MLHFTDLDTFLMCTINMEDAQYKSFNVGVIQRGVKLTHIIKYWIKFEDKYGTPIIKMCLSNDMLDDKIFVIPVMVGAIYVPDIYAMTVLSK